MTDLHWALLALGALIIVAVLGFNWWQERKFKQEASLRFVSPETDALMEDFEFDASSVIHRERKEKIEPSFAAESAPIPELTAQLPDDDSIAAHYDNAQYDLDQPIANETEADSLLAEAFGEEGEAAATELSTLAEQANTSNIAYEHVSAGENDELLNDAYSAMPEPASTEELMQEAGLETLKESDVAESVVSAVDDAEITLPANVDPLIDLVAVLHLPKNTANSALHDFLVALTDLDKPMFLNVLSNQTWSVVTRESPASSFQKVACSVQLADRSGYISKAALSRFQHEVDKLGNKLSAQVEWQTKTDPWRYASELDQFCIEVDKMVGFHLTQGVSGPFTGTKFRGLAEANGLTLNEDGSYYRESDQGLRLYAVTNHDRLPFSVEMLRTSVIRGVAFKLDIPRVKNCPEIFNQMALTGLQMANNLGANFVDDNQRPVGETQLEIVRHQLRVIHSKMVARGIVPGSPSALRLFS